MSLNGVITPFTNDGTGGTKVCLSSLLPRPPLSLSVPRTEPRSAFVMVPQRSLSPDKRQTNEMPAEAATMSKNGVISAFENDGSGGTRKRRMEKEPRSIVDLL